MILPRLLALAVAFLTWLAVCFVCMFVVSAVVSVLAGGVAAELVYWVVMCFHERRR